MLEMARRRHRSLWSVMVELEGQPGLLRLSRETRDRLSRLRRDLRSAMTAAHARPGGEVLYEHLTRSGRLRELVADADRGDEAALRNVARFFELVRRQSAVVADDRLEFLVPHLRTLADAGDDTSGSDADAPDDAIAVLTVHKAKGLEFPVVFLVGLVDGRFPLRGRTDALSSPDLAAASGPARIEALLAEERRLCYVAMTRARDELHLSWSRTSAGGRSRRPSPFVAEALDLVSPPSVDEGGHGSDALVARIAAGLERPAEVPSPVVSPTVPDRSGPLALSFSQIDDYLSCPLKYRLRHQVRVPTPPHHALVLGNALHQAAAAFHTAQMRGRILTEAEVLDVFDSHWSSEGFLSREHEEARYAAGRAALSRFRASQLEPEASVPEAVERPFSVRIDADVVRGRYDRVDRTPDGAVITDYKSSDVRDQRKADEKARASLQLQVYALAHEAETGELPAEVRLHFLESGVVGTARPDPARLERARSRISQAAAGIKAGEFGARPEYLACTYCPYREVCPSSAA